MDDALAAKADFDDIYSAPDPRPYFRTLGPLDYRIPGEMAPLVRRALDLAPGEPRPVLDLCCSYGLNGALLRTDLDFEDLAAHYVGTDLDGLDPGAVADADREYVGSHLRPDAPVVRGLDVAEPAISYATDVGLLSAGWSEDLEGEDGASAELTAGIADTGLLTCTGGIGYVTDRTVGRVLDGLAAPESVWVLSSVLRSVSYEPVRSACASYGLVTERVPVPPLRQRRFADDDEARGGVTGARAWGFDTAGLEETGWYYAEAWLSRPAADVEALPIEELAGEALDGGRLAR